MNNQIEIIMIHSKTINFAMQQNDIPIIKELHIKNNSDETYTDISIDIHADPECIHAWTADISVLPAKQTVNIDVSSLSISSSMLYELTESIVGNISVKINSHDDELTSVNEKITLMAYDEWPGYLYMPEILAAYVTPNHPMIARIIGKAGEYLKKCEGSSAFTGYQSKNPNTVRNQLASLYEALKNEEIMYCAPPASFENIGQRVRMCDSIVAQRMATCFDFSLLYAACMEAVGLYPLIIFIKQHAFCGCMLEEECFSECVQDDISILTKKSANGVNEICLVDAVKLAKDNKSSFDDACLTAGEYLKKSEDFELFIDIHRCRLSRIRPIPLRVRAQDGTFMAYEEVKKEKKEVFEAPKQLDIVDIDTQTGTVTRQNMWERKLLDMSLRNPLLNFRTTKSTMQLLSMNLSSLEDALASGDEFSVLERPTDFENELSEDGFYEVDGFNETLLQTLNNDFKSKKVRTFYEKKDIDRRLKELYRQAKVGLEENGANTLYLALGFLKWYETDVSEKPRYAPLVLWPIEIVKKSAQIGYVIRFRDEEPQMNITLLEFLKNDFEIDIAGLDPLPTDDNGIDMQKVFTIMRKSVMNKSRWDIIEIANVGIFSFSQFIMWNDIRNRSEELKNNKIVSSLIDGKLNFSNEEDFPVPETLDDMDISELAVPLSADSSQLSAVCAASKGNSFVLHGPPGTGKSQTITNMIANALYQGKSVLFIAEKMAALSVVKNRLDHIGLGPFCLELHSNKAKKKDVLEQFENILEYSKVASAKNFEEEAKKLHKLRAELNDMMKLLHKKQSFGFSLYEAIARAEQYEQYKDLKIIADQDIDKFTSETYERWINLCDMYITTSQAAAGASSNSLRGLNSSEYSNALKDELGKTLNEYETVLKEFVKVITVVTDEISLEDDMTYGWELMYAELINHINEVSDETARLASMNNLGEYQERIAQICDNGIKAQSINTSLMEIFSERVYELDCEVLECQYNQAQASWFIPKLIKTGAVKKEVLKYVKHPEKFDKGSLLQYIEQIKEYTRLTKSISAIDDEYKKEFGSLYSGVETDFNKLLTSFEQAVWIDEYMNELAKSAVDKDCMTSYLCERILADKSSYFKEISSQIELIAKNYRVIDDCEQALIRLEKVDTKKLHLNNNDKVYSIVSGWRDSLEELKDWANYIKARDEMNEAGLSNLTKAYEDGELNDNDLIPTLHKNVATTCAIHVMDAEDKLLRFSGVMFEKEIDKYKQANNNYENLTKLELIARLSANIPEVGDRCADSSEIGILNRAIKSRGRMMPIRKLFDMVPTLIRKLCPCMLMSPMSVAQYIDPSFPQFDMVIFDEASQLPTCEAVGAIARGKNLIVVGDPKQLPPTSFFSTNRVDEENYDKEDLESILDDCLALSMPSEHLLWHYRSRHESLIAFSNRQYYDNKLYTFPSPNDLVSEVKHIQVEGYYDRGKTKQNQAEARAVVDEIVRRLKDEELSKQSIGVVTFSSVQQNLIDDMLSEEFAKQPELEEINGKSNEPVFIKNLENVQGDERDVIMFSIGYGPDMDGKVALNFGPLNRDGGWRRLNVAVSRARRQMLVFSVLKPEQIDTSRTTSDGLAGLKAFLEFAMYGKSMLPVNNIAKSDKSKVLEFCGIESLIANELTKAGYKVNTEIGCSEYKIDLGVVNPLNEDEYILGIMCDGDNYRNAPTSRDRNILQESILKSLGWNIQKVWTLDWWNSKKKVTDAIIERIEKLKKDYTLDSTKNKLAKVKEEEIIRQLENSKILDELTKQGQEKAKNESQDNSAISKYIIADIVSDVAINPETADFYNVEYDQVITNQLVKVINIEAPISKNALIRRILDAWNIGRKTSRIEERIDNLLSKVKGIQAVNEKDAVFYWNVKTSPENYLDIRSIEECEYKRNAEDISKYEASNAIMHVLKSQLSLLKEDLDRETIKILGYSRITQGLSDMIARGYELLLEHELIIEENNRVILKSSKNM